MRRATLALVALLLATPAAASAQSLLSVDGFGSPLYGMSARARALGGIGVGLSGAAISALDPAVAARVDAAMLVFVGSTAAVDVTQGDVGSDYTTSRFPLLAASYPAGQWGVVSFTFSSVLDQTWEDIQPSTVDIGGGGQAFVRDVFVSEGGVSALEFGIARQFGGVSVGARAGRYTGSLRRNLTRVFDSVTVGSPVPLFQTGGRWDYSGFTGTLGAAAELGEQAFLSGSIRLGGDLDAAASEDTEAADRTVSMPTRFRVGGSYLLAPDLVANAGLQYADWSSTDPTGQTEWTMGGGIEWTGSRILGKAGAWRIGGHRAQLPFRPDGADSANETVFSGGLALELVQTEQGALGWFDLSVEFGSRSFGDVSENLFRTTLSVSIAGS